MATDNKTNFIVDRDHEIDHFFKSFDKELFSNIPPELVADYRILIAAGLTRLFDLGYRKAIYDVSSLEPDPSSVETNQGENIG